MAVRKRLFTSESVEGTDDDFLKNKKNTPPVETSENNDTIAPVVASTSYITENKKETKKPKTIKKTIIKEKAEAKEDIEVTDEIIEIENNSPIQLTLKTHNKDIKKYVTFFMRESTIALIAQYAGRGKGKDRTGYDKSEFVDLMLVKAITALKWNKEV